MAIVEQKSPTFDAACETIKWLYLLCKCAIKQLEFFDTGRHSCQLNSEPTGPNGFVGCKVPTDLVKISVKGLHVYGSIL